MTKEQFVETINFIKKQQELEDRFSNMLGELSPGSMADAFIYSEYETKILELLSDIFNLDVNDDIIGWWIYDAEFGTKNPIVYLDKEEFVLDTAEKLYDYLTTK